MKPEGASARHDFALIVPAWNEAPNMPHLIRELRAAFDEHGLTGEVILVDDGSTDGTADLALEHGAGWDALRVLRHCANRGKTEAMVTAAQATRRTHLVLFDADLQHLPDEIPRFLDKLDEGWDIVTGRKVGRYDKRAVSSIYNALSRRIFDVPVSDLNSMKAFRAEVLRSMRLRHDWHRFFVVIAHRRGFSATEIDIELHPRRAGEAKYSGKSRIGRGRARSGWPFWFQLRFSRKPMVAFGIPGLLLTAAGLAHRPCRALLSIRSGAGFPAAPVPGRPSGHGGGAVVRRRIPGRDDRFGARRSGRPKATDGRGAKRANRCGADRDDPEQPDRRASRTRPDSTPSTLAEVSRKD